MKTEVYKKGHILFREGDQSDQMYYVDSGSVAILIKNERGEQIPVSILRKGDFLGEFAFFDNEIRSATAMINESTTLKVIDKHTISSLGKNGLFIIKALIKKLKKMNEIAVSTDEAA